MVPETQTSATERTSTASQAQEDTDGGVRTIYNALTMTMLYGKEYVDDLPLLGEPGNFRLSKNKEASAAAGQIKGHGQALSTSPTGTPSASRAVSVAAPMLSNPAMVNKGPKAGEKAAPAADGSGKAKRRKSKVGVPSP